MMKAYRARARRLSIRCATLVIIISIVSSLTPFAPRVHASVFSGVGSGTSLDPYVITTCQQLEETALDLTADYVLGNDIDCSMTNPANGNWDPSGTWSDGTGFHPIGTTSGPNWNITHENFTGVFDGQNHVIHDLFIHKTGDWTDTSGYYIGLFSTIGAGGQVMNLGLENVNITSDHGNDIGALAGGLSGTVTNVHSTGVVNGVNRVGGLVGVHVDSDNYPNSSPLVYSWNGTKYVYTDDVGGILPKTLSGVDLASIDSQDVAPKDGKYSFNIAEEYNEIVYYDQLKLETFDHQPGYSVVEPLDRTAGEAQLRTVNDTPTNPLIGCTDDQGKDCTDALKSYDDKWSYSNPNGVYNPSNLHKYWILDFGDLSQATSSIQLVLRGARDYAASAQYLTNAARSIQVKDANGNWVEIYNKSQIGSDGSPRLRTIDLTGKFLSNDYHVKVIMDTFNANYFAVDTSPQVPFTENIEAPDSVNLNFHGFTAIDHTYFFNHLYDQVSATPSKLFKNQYGNFTKYGDVTPLLQNADDQYAIMRYGDQLSTTFPYVPPAPGMERSYILYTDALYKHATNGNLGALGQSAAYLPYHGMTQYSLSMTPYPLTQSNQDYINTWNTRYYPGPFADALTVHSSTIINSYASTTVNGSYYVGGLVGYNEKEIRTSYSTGDVSGYYYIGGLVGESNDGWIHDDYETGRVTGSGITGGLVGWASNLKIERSYSSGIVDSGGSEIGGLAGQYYFIAPYGIFDSFTTSPFAQITGGYLGGIAGFTLSDGSADSGNYWFNNISDAYGISNSNPATPTLAPSAEYFMNSTTTGPFANWDFTTIWEAHHSSLPTFSAGDPPISYYTLTYTAGTGGTLTGSTTQTVASGGTGNSVMAVPNSGYAFLQWSDANTTNPRIDTNVTGSATTSAIFQAIPTSPTNTVSRSGGSVVSQVHSLEAIGNNKVATTLVQEFPNLFTPATPGGTAAVGATGSAKSAARIKSGITYKANNNSVKILQQLFANDPSLNYTGGVTGYYGKATQAAVQAFQVKYGVIKPGRAGYGTVGPKTRLALIAAYGV